MPAYQEEKLCPDCERLLPRSAFYSKGRSKMDGKLYLTTRCKECHKAWRRANRDAETRQMKRWRLRQRERWNAYMREWRAKHRGYDEHRKQVYRQLSNRARVKRREWRAIIAAFDGLCAYCGCEGPLEVDHFVPSSKGGSDCLSNYVPSCRSCNASKNDRHPRDVLSRADYDRIVKVLSSYG